MDICKRYMNSLKQNRQEEKVEELSLETVRKYGIENYGGRRDHGTVQPYDP